MNLFEKLAGATGVKMLCGMSVLVGPEATGRRRFGATVEPRPGSNRPADLVLLALHYYSQVLARYSKEESRTYDLGADLRALVYHIIDEGIWPGSDLIRYAQAYQRMEFVAAIDKPARVIRLALIRPLLGDDLDIAFDGFEGATEEELILSVVAVLQGLMTELDPAGLELLDRALRYLQSYHEEGADWTVQAAARNMSNRALRAAGADAA